MGIILSALAAAGDSGVQSMNQNIDQQNKFDLAKRMSDLEVQKATALIQMQLAQKRAAFNAMYPSADSTPQNTPVQVANPVAQAPVATSPTQTVGAVTPLDPNQGWDGINAQVKARQPDADAASVALLQNEYAKETDPANRAALERSITRLGGTVGAQDQGGAAPSNGWNGASPVMPPSIWTPSRNLMEAALNADMVSQGAGAEILKANAPDAMSKTLLAQGIMPGTQAWVDGHAAAQLKAVSSDLRPGGIITVRGMPIFAAPVGGVATTFDSRGNATAAPVPGYAASEGAIEAGRLHGKNPEELAPESAWPVDSQGRKIPTTISGAIANGGSGKGAGLAPGQPAAADASQKELSEKWTSLNQQNQQAQSTISLLQGIKTQAAKAAIGPLSDRIDFANGLLSLVGNDRATDAVTAHDLLEKQSNQIVARLGGAGGLSTDAGRAIVASAYPNTHMNLPAINEAADNLVGAVQMIQSKTQMLSPIAATRDPVAYQKAEVAFDKVADPRIFQWKNIQDPKMQAMFLQNAARQDPTILSKINALQGMGALQ